jgi:type IV pilus assembly protein PilV
MFQRFNTKKIRHRRHAKNNVNQKGMTFIEVLIALVIMVTGILGAVAMQATAKKGSFDAMQRSLASSLAQDILERMRTNGATNLNSYAGTDYGVALNGLPDKRCRTSAGLCSTAEMVTNDQYEWELALMGADVKNGTSNAGGLVGARACIVVPAAPNNNRVTVVVTWQGRSALVNGNTQSCGDANSKRRQVLVEGFIY